MMLYACYISRNILSTHIHISMRTINIHGKTIMKSKGIYEHKFRIIVTSEGRGSGRGPQGTSEVVMMGFFPSKTECWIYTGGYYITVLYF